ncbi:hypothetical protein J5N97_022685 [Dioscorea zingiberensis]|uniref:Prolyl oligopeptidase n=1 Tax=Dioscorea zingiberensis TaxID=325984 RepID=A0A9D5CAV2_9LILI|nr:hypothetical protein J5N97_022685 [Dioscorea zingiberensis]
MGAVSEDAQYLAYGLSSSGSDWVTIKVMIVADKKTLPDTLSWVKFSSISWTQDGKGFFYSRYPAPKEHSELDAGTETNINLNHELYYHFLGTRQSEDILCWRDPENPKYLFSSQVTDDGKYLLLDIEEGCDPVNKLYYCDLSALPLGLGGYKDTKSMLPFIKLVDNFEASYRAVSNDDTEFTFISNKDAPKYKLIRVNIKEPGLWTDVLPESAKDVLESAYAVNGNQLLVSYLSDVKYVVQLLDLKNRDLAAPVTDRYWHSTGVPEMKIFREILVPGFDRSDFQVKTGHAWTSDYGCSDIKEEFEWLIKYSPLHNVRRPWEKPAGEACQYPPTMLLTADHDDRVVPLHSLKLLATMQYVLCTSINNSPQTNPIIARIDRKAGHGAGRPTQKMIDETADRYSFLAKMMGASWIG